MIADMLSNKKKLNSIVAELFIRHRKLNIALVLSCNNIFQYEKMFSLSKYLMKENFNLLRIIIHQILTLKTLCIFTKNALQGHNPFQLLMLLLHQVILHVSERMF